MVAGMRIILEIFQRVPFHTSSLSKIAMTIRQDNQKSFLLPKVTGCRPMSA